MRLKYNVLSTVRKCISKVAQCAALGEKTGLYKGKMVSKGCTPEYLPEFIVIESDKRKL